MGPFMEQPLLEWWGNVKDTVLYHLDAHSLVGGSLKKKKAITL